MEFIFSHYVEFVAIILFGIGFSLLIFNNNLMKKIMGLNIMDSGVYLFLASMGYISGKFAPIFNGSSNPSDYINPIPAGLVLTGIVVSVSVTAIMLSLSIKLYGKYHTLNLDEIYEQIRKEEQAKDEQSDEEEVE